MLVSIVSKSAEVHTVSSVIGYWPDVHSGEESSTIPLDLAM
jgi:hypothetical protein